MRERLPIHSTLITLILFRLQSPQSAASGQNGWAHDWFYGSVDSRHDRVCRAESADINRLFLVGPFAHISAESCGPATGLCPRTFAPAIWLVAASMRRCHIPAMHCCFGELANGRIHQS